MLDINSETVCRIISRAQEFHAQEDVVIPEDPLPGTADNDWPTQVLAAHQGDLTYQEIAAVIDSLEPAQQIALVALMWLGRGDFTAEEWEDALAQARDQHNERTADYLIATPQVADYLEEGLSMLGLGCGEEREHF